MKYTSTIKHNHLFKRLYHKGKTQVTPYLAMYVLKNQSSQDKNLLGFTVGTKLGGAVSRNRVRRKLREIYRLQENNLKTGYLIVIVARNRCASANYHQLEKSFLLLCDQLELSKNPMHPPKYQKPQKEFQKRKEKSKGNNQRKSQRKEGPRDK